MFGNGPVLVGHFVECNAGRGRDTVGRSPLVRELPQIPLLFIEQLAGDRPVFVGQFVESNVGI